MCPIMFDTTRSHHSRAQVANLQNLSTKMDSYGTAQQEATEVQQNILSKVEKLNNGIDSLQAAAVNYHREKVSSASRLNDIFENFRSVLQDVLSKNQINQSIETGNETPASVAAADAADETASTNMYTAHPDIGRKIQAAIDILRELARDKGTCGEAESLLAKTQYLFEILRQSELEGPPERSVLKSTKRKRTDNDSEEDLLFDRELKKLRAVSLSETVNINMKGR